MTLIRSNHKTNSKQTTMVMFNPTLSLKVSAVWV